MELVTDTVNEALAKNLKMGRIIKCNKKIYRTYQISHINLCDLELSNNLLEMIMKQ